MRTILLTLLLLAACAAWPLAGSCPAQDSAPSSTADSTVDSATEKAADGALDETPEQTPGEAQLQTPPPRPRPIERAFGLTLGEPLPLSSKQVLGVSSPGPGLERYHLLFTPGARPPFAHHFATLDSSTRRVVAMTAQTRPLKTREKTWKTFLDQIARLEKNYGAGMRLGGGNIWKITRKGRSITLAVNLQARVVSLRLADERRLGLGQKF